MASSSQAPPLDNPVASPAIHVHFCSPTSSPPLVSHNLPAESPSSPSATDDRHCQPNSPADASSSQPQSRHSRTFSGTFSSAPSPDLSPPTKRLATRRSLRSLTRPTSSAGLPSLVHMTFGFKDKGKAVKKDTSPLSGADEAPPSRRSRFAKEAKKKRSLATFLHSFTSESSSIASTSSQASSATSLPLAESSDIIRPHVHAPSGTPVRAQVSDDEEDYGALIPKFKQKPYFKRRMGMKTHPYSEDVPYMQTYDPTPLENDHYTHLLLQRLAGGNPSFHDYGANPPKTVLDIGCGKGDWLLHAAETWRNNGTVLTGIDMVDIRSSAVKQHDNIRFIQSDFVGYQLPFPDDAFDMVRVANIGTSIRTQAWPDFMDQVQRVIAPGGRVEVIDDFIFFPYGASPAEANAISPVTPKGGPDSSCHLKGSICATPDGSESSTESATDEDSLFECQSIACTSVTSTSARSSLRSDHSFGKAPILPATISLPPLDLELDAPPSASSSRPNPPSRPLPPLPVREVLTAEADCMVVAPECQITPQATPASESQSVLDDDVALTASPICTSSESEPLSRVYSRDATAASTTWLERTRESQNLEQVFKAMLDKREVSQPPSSFIADILHKSFGEANCQKRAMHLCLAPPECTNSNIALAFEDEEDHLRISSDELMGVKRSRIKIEWEKKDKKAEKRHAAAKETGKASVASLTLVPPPTPSDDSDSFATSTNVPEGISAKAAGRLGIAYMSAPYSPATTAPPTRPPSVYSLPSSRRPTQSPGLILLPSTYIPIPPAELEMHACKNMHLLLSCKPALHDFISTFVDGDEQRIVDDAEFEESIWDYECFRRQRFHWPANLPDAEVDMDDTSGTLPPTPKTPDFSRSTSMSMSKPRSDSISTKATASYASEDLVHVRTIHVFEAVKPDQMRLITQPVPMYSTRSEPSVRPSTPSIAADASLGSKHVFLTDGAP